MDKKIFAVLGAAALLALTGAGCAAVNQNYNTNAGANTNANANVPAQGKVLNLSNQGLASVDMGIFNRIDLTELNLSHNNLKDALPSQVGQLKNLQVLNLSYNKFTGVPAEVGQLKKLLVLDLSNNQLTGLPYEIGNLTQLQVLNVSGNAYSEADLAKITSTLPNTQIIK